MASKEDKQLKELLPKDCGILCCLLFFIYQLQHSLNNFIHYSDYLGFSYYLLKVGSIWSFIIFEKFIHE